MNPPVSKEFLLRIPKEATTIKDNHIFFNENYMGQCCGAWVSMFFMALDDLSRTYISCYAVNSSGHTYYLSSFNPKEHVLEGGYGKKTVQPTMEFNHKDEESGRTLAIPRFAVYFETCIGDPGITTNDVLMWIIIYDPAFRIEEYMLEYLSKLKVEMSKELVDLKELTTSRKTKQKRRAVQTNESGDIHRLLANYKMYVDGCKYLSLLPRSPKVQLDIFIDSPLAPSIIFRPKDVLSRLTGTWNYYDPVSYTDFHHRTFAKPFQQAFGYDFITNHAKFNSLMLPYVVPMQVYRCLTLGIVQREFPTIVFREQDVPEIVDFRYVSETDIDSFFYVHCYFLMWKQMLDEKLQLYRYLSETILNLTCITLTDEQRGVFPRRLSELRVNMLNSFLKRVKDDLRPYEGPAMLGNCSEIEHAIWTAAPNKNIFDPSNFIPLRYGRNGAGESLDLDESLLLFNHYMLTYDLMTDFGPRQNMRWGTQLFFDCAASTPVGYDIAMVLMCGDPSVGKGTNMKQVSRMYPPGILKTLFNISISFFNNYGNMRGYVIFLDEIKKQMLDSKMDTTIINHLKNIASSGYTSSNQQTAASSTKERIAFPYLAGVIQASGNFSDDFIFTSDDALFSRCLNQCSGIRPKIEHCRPSGDLTSIRIFKAVYNIFAKFVELQYIGFFDINKAMSPNIRKILQRFFAIVSEHPHYSVYNRTQGQIEMRYNRLVARYATMKVMCTTWGYNLFHDAELTEPTHAVFQAINDQVQPSEKILIFVLSLFCETFFSNDSFVIEKEFHEAYRAYLANSRLVLKEVVYTINTASGIKTSNDPFYLKLNVTMDALFDRVKRKNKLGRITFLNGLRSLEKKEKFEAEIDNYTCEYVIPKTKSCDGETILANSGKMRREVSPYIFHRSQDNRILDIYVSITYLEKMIKDNIENYFETFILPNILPHDLSNTPLLTFGGIQYDGCHYIENLNYVPYDVRNRETENNKRLRSSGDTPTINIEPVHDPIDIYTLMDTNGTFRANNPECTIPTMFDLCYPRDAIVKDNSIRRRDYTSEELHFLVFSTEYFKHAANSNTDEMAEISLNFDRITANFKQRMATLCDEDRMYFGDLIDSYRSVKTTIDDNCLVYYHADLAIKKLYGMNKDCNTWVEISSLLLSFQEYCDQIETFSYETTVAEFQLIDENIRLAKERFHQPALYAQLFAKFPFELMQRNNRCPNRFMKDNRLYSRVSDFTTQIFTRFMNNDDFKEHLATNFEGRLIPPIIDDFYTALGIPL